MLIGRDPETARLRELVDTLLSGTAASLLVLGEPGMGKSALLETVHPIAADRGVRVVLVSAVESESGMPGALLEVLRGRLGRSGEPASMPPARQLLDDLVAASSRGPLLVVIDDVHWLDGETLRALTFAARRLLAEPVGVLLAGRPESRSLSGLAEVPRLELTPLDPASATELLRAKHPEMPLDTAESVARSLGSVPLALVEAGALLSPDQMWGRASIAPVQVGPAVTERYAVGFRSTPGRTQVAATVLAADDGAGSGPLPRALQLAGIDLADLRAAEEAGLVTLGAQPRFVHPLARSAVYSAASPSLRRRAHHAWASAASESQDRLRELRHRAAAAEGPDEHLATALEAEAERLAAASLPEASTTAETAADLSESYDARTRRLVIAAETSRDVRRTRALVARVLASDADAELIARALMATDLELLGITVERLETLLAALDLDAVPEDLRVRLDVTRIWAAVDSTDVARLQALTSELDRGPDRGWLVTATLGVAYTFVGQHRLGVERLRSAEAASRLLAADEVPLNALWDWSIIPGWLGDDMAEHRRRVAEMSRRFRAAGGQPILAARAAFFTAERARRDGHWRTAEAMFTESADIGLAWGENPAVEYARLAVLAACRHELDTARSLLARAADGFRASVASWNNYWLDHARGMIAVASDQPDVAVQAFRSVAHAPFVGRGCRDAMSLSAFELIEVLAALGRRDEAAAELDLLAPRLAGIVDPLGLAVLHRCRALVEPDRAVEEFERALELHASADEPFERARTQLLFGEFLRRHARPKDARSLLSAANITFGELDATAWAARAGLELRSSGGAVRPDAERPDADLSPQEFRVALAVCEGMTNAEVAAALFLSVKTVEFHLGRVYRKLGIRSRSAVRPALEARGVT